MSTLVTGAAGFTATALLKLLETTCGEIHTTDLVPLQRPLHWTGSLVDKEWAMRLLEKTKPDRVYHLAGSFTGEYDRDYAANVATTQVLLESARGIVPSCRILLVGSAAEYGAVAAAANPVPETHPLRPTSVYGLTKSFQTQLARYYHDRFGTHLVLARTFNLWGPGISQNLLPGRLDQEIARFTQSEIHEIHLGPLDARRDFLHVDDAARYYIQLLDCGEPGEVYNVASGHPMLVRDFVSRKLQMEGLSIDIVREGSRSGSLSPPIDIWADVRKVSHLPPH